MHYRDGKPAQVGDFVIGAPGAEFPGHVAGELVAANADAQSCNGTVVVASDPLHPQSYAGGFGPTFVVKGYEQAGLARSLECRCVTISDLLLVHRPAGG